MAVTVTSTTDSNEAVMAAQGGVRTVSPETEAKEEIKSESAQADESAHEESETSEDTEKPDEGEEKPKKGKGFEKRIKKLNSKLKAEQEEKEYWRQKALNTQSSPEPEVKKPVLEGKPAPDEFESHEAYVEALTDWKLDKKLAEKEADAKAKALKTDYQKQIDKHLERVEEFKKEHKDFEDVMEDVDEIPLSIAVQEAILSSDSGPALMYELAKDKKEFERICKLPAMQAARAIGRIEAQIESESSKKEIKQTKAPKPINPVGGKGSAASTVPLDQLPFQEFKKAREAQLRR